MPPNAIARRSRRRLRRPLHRRSGPAAGSETWAIDRLKPYNKNARKHSIAQIHQIQASLREELRAEVGDGMKG